MHRKFHTVLETHSLAEPTRAETMKGPFRHCSVSNSSKIWFTKSPTQMESLPPSVSCLGTQLSRYIHPGKTKQQTDRAKAKSLGVASLTKTHCSQMKEAE